jgi:hypothetical protein
MIKKQLFQYSKSGFFTSGSEKKMLDRASDLAQEWINQQNKIKVVDISLTVSQISAIVVVWYREL